MIRAILIDDEATMRANFSELLGIHLPDIQVVAEASGVTEGLEVLRNESCDLLFLDVEMQDGTGFDLLDRFGETRFKTVFVTGHDRYAIRAFKFSAVDYLVKPVDPTELKKAVSKVRQMHASEQRQALHTLVGNHTGRLEERKILLKNSDALFLVKVNQIVRCEADNNYTRFFLEDGQEIIISKTLKEYERLFEDFPFFRAHQSHLINLQHFERYEKREGGAIQMRDGTRVPLANRKKEAFLSKIESLAG